MWDPYRLTQPRSRSAAIVGRRQIRNLTATVSSVCLAMGLCLASPFPANGQTEATVGSSERVKDSDPAAIRDSVSQDGGIKAAMTGGNTVYADVREAHPRQDGYRHIDTPALISRLESLGLNTYIYGIWDSPTDWDDLQNEFAPAAEAAGIRVWVYIVPPSECLDSAQAHRSGRCSRPYKMDYVSWAREIATLSTQHRNIVAWAIDDFVVAENSELFTPEYMERIVDEQDSINAQLGFYTTAYFDEATDPDFYDRFAPYIDGIIYPYLGASSNTQDPSQVGNNLDTIFRQTEPRGLSVLLLQYAGRLLDAGLPPTEDYVAKTIENAMPYVRDGRILGIDEYGLPLSDRPAITADNRAAHGIGRFSVSLSPSQETNPGDYAQADQTVRIDQDAEKYSLRFVDFDWYYGNLSGSGQHMKQVLVDGKVQWQSDVTDPGGHDWREHIVDLTSALNGKEKATIALRVFDENGVEDMPLDVGFDDLEGEGFTIKDGGFESADHWQVSTNNKSMLPAIDLYATDRPARIREAVATTMRGTPFVNRPFEPEAPTGGYRTDNRAMYGSGRLSFSVPEKTPTPAGACTSANQTVDVDPDSPRQEISFWDYDQYARAEMVWGHHIKRLVVDGHEVYHHDVADSWEFTWMNGESAQGPIDVTEFTKGKDNVTVSFQLCEENPVSDLGVDVGFDNIETVGLHVHNPDFESKRGWQLESTDPALKPEIVLAR